MLQKIQKPSFKNLETLQNIFQNQIKNTQKMNQITHEDFGFFQTELLQVDFITFNLTKLSNLQISQLATYFRSLGFNSYLKKAETSQSRPNKNHFQNKFELDIILKVPYQKDMPGLSANQFYKLIKQKSIQWEKLTKFDIVLSRFDLVYERSHKLNDKISTKSSYIQFQDLHPRKNLVSERNIQNRSSKRTKNLHRTEK